MKISPIIALLVLVSHCSAFNTPEGFRELPEHLQIGDYAGSGFFFRSTNSLFLVTAKHVIFDPQSGSMRGTNLILTGWGDGAQISNVFQVNATLLLSNKLIRSHATRDITLVKVINFPGGGVTGQLSVGITAQVHKEPRSVSFDSVRRMASITNISDVYVFGYPSVGTVTQPQQLAPLRPLMRQGNLADIDNARKLLVLDAMVFGGNSGGPALQVVQDFGMNTTPNGFAFYKNISYSVIGIVTQFVPYEEIWVNLKMPVGNHATWQNSGYSIAEPIDFILDMLWD